MDGDRAPEHSSGDRKGRSSPTKSRSVSPQTVRKIGNASTVVNATAVSPTTFFGGSTPPLKLKRTDSSRAIGEIASDSLPAPATSPKAGTAHTKFQIVPEEPIPSAPSPPSSNVPSLFPPASQTSSKYVPSPLTHVSPLTHEPLDEWREPEAVPDDSATPAIGWTDPGTTSTWPEYWDNQPSSQFGGAPLDWWDHKYQTRTPEHPGPGQLAPIVEANVMEDTLFIIKILEVPLPPAPVPGAETSFVPPTLDEVQRVIPQGMYYSKTSNGWMHVSISNEHDIPPPREDIPRRPFPSEWIRSQRVDCTVPNGVVSEWHNGDRPKVHHFHMYEETIDSTVIPQPFSRSDIASCKWPTAPSSSSELSGAEHENDENTMDSKPSDSKDANIETSSGVPLDAFICSLCRTYLLATHDPIPGVLPVDVVDAFVADRRGNPLPGIAGEVCVVKAWDIIIKFANSIFVSSVAQLKYCCIDFWRTACSRARRRR